MAKKTKSKLTHSITQNGNAIAFTNTLTPEQLTKHESWLIGHGMTAHATSTLGGGSIETADKLVVVPEGRTIVLTFKDAAAASAVFEEIFGEGALDADEWDDDTKYEGGSTRDIGSALGTLEGKNPKIVEKKAVKKTARR